jgi:vacuolar-type H+-ATPase subunit F/Vma7
MKIISLTNAQIAIGLRLGGIRECHVINNPEEAKEKLLELSEDREAGILLVDDGIARLHHEVIDEIRTRKGVFPIIVEIQTHARQEAAKGTDPLRNLIKRAIGVDISSDQPQTKPKI